ncbi:MAG: TolC family protein [Epsilonproteobacteria bacterium]|nr:MAG: TolC family protein [Campylobacterota bacterium]
MKKTLLSLLLCSIVLSATETYTVDELILLAMENSPDIQISSSKIDASQSRIDKASGSYLPTINLHVSAGETGQSDVPNNKDKMVDDTLLLGKLSVKQLLYDFGRTGSNVDSFKYESEVFKMDNEQNISDKKLNVKVEYYNILQAKALINVQKENVKLNDIQLYRSQKYFEAGIKTKIDISDAKVQLIQAKLALKEAEYSLKSAYAGLDKVLGFKEITNNYEVYTQDLDYATLYSCMSEYTLNLADSIEFANANRYELKKYIANLKVSKAKTEVADSFYYPEIYADASYTRQEADEFDDIIPQNQWHMAVNLDWNIYEGGATDAASQEKIIQEQTANFELENAKLSIKKDITDSYIDVSRDRDTVELSQSLVEVSSEKYVQAEKRYEHGLSDYIELQQSRQDYIDAKAKLVVNYYKYYQSIAYLDNAIGK